MMSGGKRFATIAADVTVPEVKRMRRLSARNRSISAAAASTSPTLAPWIQTSGPAGRTSALMPRRSPTRAGSSLPCFSRRLISAGTSGTATVDSRRYNRKVIGSELAMLRLFRTAEPGVDLAGRFVQNGLDMRPDFFHRLGVGVRRHPNRFNADQAAASERQVDRGAIPVLEADKTAGRHREWHDRSPGFPRQHDDAKSSDARTLGYVRR